MGGGEGARKQRSATLKNASFMAEILRQKPRPYYTQTFYGTALRARNFLDNSIIHPYLSEYNSEVLAAGTLSSVKDQCKLIVLYYWSDAPRLQLQLTNEAPETHPDVPQCMTSFGFRALADDPVNNSALTIPRRARYCSTNRASSS